MSYELKISTYEDKQLLFIENTIGTIEEKVLSYSNDVDDIKIYLENFCLIKENNDSKLKINNYECLLTLKELKQSMNIPLEYVCFNSDNKRVVVEYKLISQERPLKIVIEIGDVIDA